jgi:3-hydroxyanthranilate 3,4-dioxygenase
MSSSSSSSSPTSSTSIRNVGLWIDENKSDFGPPVCNKMMHGAGQLKVMFVGGPNERKDYHLEEGEELFFQLRGAMRLDTWQHGARKSIEIGEDHLFVLPAYVPHSPQRSSETVGLVLERERVGTEIDCLRYYVSDESDDGADDALLFQRCFHCRDLGVQLGPVISEFFASEAHRTGRPDPNDLPEPTPIPIDDRVALVEPIALADWLRQNADALAGGAPVYMFERPEVNVRVSAHVGHCGAPEALRCEKFVWLRAGTATVTLHGGDDDEHHKLGADDSLLVQANVKHAIERTSDGAIVLEMWMTSIHTRPTSF